MRVPLSWLKEFVEITLPLDTLVHRLTMAGLEISNVESIGADWQRDKLFVGEIVDIQPHPNADRFSWRWWSTARERRKRSSRAHRTCAWRAWSQSGVCRGRGQTLGRL